MPTPAARHPELLAYRAEFPLLERSTYLNTCSLGARSERSRRRLESVPGRLGRARRAGLVPAMARGARRPARRLRRHHWRCRQRDLAGTQRQLGAGGRRLGDRPHPPRRSRRPGPAAAAGVAAGSRPRTRVVTTALDFPTVGHQWLARAPLGVELVVVPSADGMTVALEDFAAAIDERTALVATGHVYFTTGATERHGGARPALPRERGAAAGRRLPGDRHRARPTCSASEVDIYVSGTLKWLFGGPGNRVPPRPARAPRRAAPDDHRVVQQRAPVRIRGRRAGACRRRQTLRARHALGPVRGDRSRRHGAGA